MTFRSDEFKLIYREYPMFCLWAVTRGILFIPMNEAEDSDDALHYDLTSKVYTMMKRLHQSYSEIMLMDSDERDIYFKMEMDLMKEEAAQAKENNKNL